MGCRCDSPKEPNMGEYEFDDEQINNSSNTIALKNKRNSTKSDLKEIEIIQNKFLEEINEIEDYVILNTIDIKEYLTFESLQAFEIFTNEYPKFQEIVEKFSDEFKNKIEMPKEDNNNNDGDKNKDNDINNSKIFKMPPIKYIKNNSIYEGEFFFDSKKNQFNYAGDGILITPKKEFIQIKNQPKDCEYIKNGRIFYPNGDIFIGEITKEEPYSKIKGIFFENVNGNYENHTKSNNFNDNLPYIIKHFKNGDIYKGEALIRENKFIFNGKGHLTKKKEKTIFEGNFNCNLYNGKGKLFKSLGSLSDKDNIKENIGKTIISNWINGKPNGEGIIQEKYSINENIKNTICCFRFGKIIKFTTCLVKNKKTLNENVFDFLNIWEISLFSNDFKTKSFMNYLKKNNSLNLNKIKVFKALNRYDKGNYNKKLFNNNIFKLDIINFNDIINNILENKSKFLPFICYGSEGGEIEIRYRPFNIFNPDMKKIYSTNYLNHKNKNIMINGIFNRMLLELFQKNEDEEEVYDIQEDHIYNLMNLASLYKDYFDKFEKNYPVRIINTDIIEYNNYILSEDKIGDLKNILCTIQYIIISIPDKIDDYNVLINPCHFLAIYIGNYENNKNSLVSENENIIDTSSKNYINIEDEDLEENNYNLKFIKEKYKKYTLKYENNKNFEYIEFDTNIQKEYENKLLCLVKINEKNTLEKPYAIYLKKFYHLGNSVKVKLINQFNPYNKEKKGNSIDFGTIHFYGDVLYLDE